MSPVAEHAYISTACQHGLHESHCRRTCDFCGAGCGCDCHTVPEPLASDHRPLVVDFELTARPR